MEPKLRITTHLSISPSELQFRFSRSGGPGGQNVNKVSSRVELVFDVAHSPSLTHEQRSRITSRLSSRMTSEGLLVVASQESRSQWRNREIAVQKFVEMVSRSLKQQTPRIATKTTRASKERRLKKKKLVAERKQTRGRFTPERD